MTRKFWIDTDPGVDDALAILMCANHPGVQIEGLGVCGGNVGLDRTVENAARLRQHLKLSFPIYAGAALPLLGSAPDAAFVHGGDGFGDAQWDEPSSPAAAPDHAAIALIQHARRLPHQLEVLALGPLSNIALALKLVPELPKLVKRLTIMGAALGQDGNISPFAEFNIVVDPEAAAIVFAHWPDALVVDWEASMRYAPSIAETEARFAQETANASFMRKISRKTASFKRSIAGTSYDQAPWAWADPIAAYAALNPELCSFERSGLEVILQGPARGATLINRRSSALQWLKKIQAEDFHAAIWKALG